MSTPLSDALIIEQIEIGPMQNFTYVIGSRETREVVVVDPAWDIDGIVNHLAERDYRLTGALITHYHPDHCGGSFGGHVVEGVAALIGRLPCPVYVNEHEADWEQVTVYLDGTGALDPDGLPLPRWVVFWRSCAIEVSTTLPSWPSPPTTERASANTGRSSTARPSTTSCCTCR